MSSAPLILFYNLENKKGSALRLLCLKLRIRVRAVKKEEYLEPVGALAGLVPLTNTVCDQDFSDEMVIMVNFGGKLLGQLLNEMRAMHQPGVALKAVLTPTNMNWNSLQLHEELLREHQAAQQNWVAQHRRDS